jgi:hypothetical protein
MFVATSANTSKSKWVPWELGLTDGWNGKAAILPILEESTLAFHGQKYFELYPEVQQGASFASIAIVDSQRSKPWHQWVREPRRI